MGKADLVKQLYILFPDIIMPEQHRGDGTVGFPLLRQGDEVFPCRSRQLFHHLYGIHERQVADRENIHLAQGMDEVNIHRPVADPFHK